jgi:cell division protease FtsH
MVLDDEEKKLLAHHEAGHAIVAAVLEHADPIHKVTIVPRGQAMGVTQQMPEKDKYLYRREYILDRLAVIMGGRAAEELVYDTATSGAENDLKQVRKMARKMVLDWGMGERFKHIALGEDQGNVFLGEELAKGREYSDETARQVDDEVREISERAFQRAIDSLRENREAFENLADALVAKEQVPGEEVLGLVNGDTEDYEEVAVANGQPTDDAAEESPRTDGTAAGDGAATAAGDGAAGTTDETADETAEETAGETTEDAAPRSAEEDPDEKA